METLKRKYNTLFEYALLVTGTLLLAIAVTVFLEPSELVTGGVSGIGIIIRSVTVGRFGVDVPLWLTNIILNIPLFILGAKTRGLAFLGRTLFSTILFSPALFLTSYIPRYITALSEIDLLLAAVFGGAVSGAGLGLVFRAAATTGGTDLAASVIVYYKQHISISKVMFILDSCIIAAGFFVFGASKAMYAIIAVYISSNVINVTLEGLSFAKAAFIISDKHDEISESILTGLKRGVTALRGMGMYTKTNKDVILCVVSKKEIVELKELVYEIDAKAFVIVADVREVLGEGFVERPGAM